MNLLKGLTDNAAGGTLKEIQEETDR